MKYLHTMIRIKDVNESLRFFCDGLGLKEIKRIESEKGRFTLLFLSAPNDENAQIELTYNWDGDDLGKDQEISVILHIELIIFTKLSKINGYGLYH